MKQLYPDLSTIQRRRADAVLTITLNRPELRNAMNLMMIQELLQTIAEVEADSKVRVVVLRGSQGHFCAGADIKEMAVAKSQRDTNIIAHNITSFGLLCMALSNCSKALITVLEGSVAGGGMGVVCASDLTLADPTATFRLPETSLGLPPAQITPYLLERLGYATSKRLMVTGATVNAEEGLRLGLIHHLLPSTDALENALQASIQQILHCAPQAIAVSKNLLKRTLTESSQEFVLHAARAFAEASIGTEGVEGAQAFLQKRKPRWSPSE